MSDMYNSSEPPRPPLTVIPVASAPRPPRPSVFGALMRWLLRTIFLLSLALNFFLFLMLSFQLGGGVGSLYERFHSGKTDSQNKIAIVRVEGVIMEGMLSYVHKQIAEAAADANVRAVVLRINSPGGSITASDDLYHRLCELRDGTTPSHPSFKKPLVVSMASVAASGGYYISMPAEQLLAERTTITGSIGVYASFPNIAGLAKSYGFGMDTIKAGGLKDSGSMFKEMRPEERQLWQEMVDHAYGQFLSVVEEGRPALKGKMREIVSEEVIPAGDGAGGKAGEVKYVRRRADGGIYTADKALKYGLIDRVGYLEDAVVEASRIAGLGSDYRAIVYDRPPSLWGTLLSADAKQNSPFDAKALASAAMPRVWYLAPSSEFAGFLSALARD